MRTPSAPGDCPGFAESSEQNGTVPLAVRKPSAAALPRWRRSPALAVLGCGLLAASPARGADSFADVIAGQEPKMVKIYGAGGVRSLESYQSGFLISPTGHILTVFSYVLDADYITATLDDGRKFEAKLVGADPRIELAVLKIEATDLPCFDLAAAVPADTGSRVLAFSNLFGVAAGDEPASVQHGTIAVKTRLDARRGTFETPYHGTVYVLDAMTNNPGAAGGAHQPDRRAAGHARQGAAQRPEQHLAQLRHSHCRAARSVEQILDGKSRPETDEQETRPAEALGLATLGLVMVPDVLERTPPYVDDVRRGSPAERAGLKPDDLVVFVGENLVHSCKGLRDELSRIERDAKVSPRRDACSGARRSRAASRAVTRGAQIAMKRSIARLLALLLTFALLVAAQRSAPADETLHQREERAMKAALARVAPSVVRIETVGGLERVGGVLIGTGPTTGLVVSPDGYIVSSAFNFAQKPDSILVTLAGGSRRAAKIVATDHSRMLVLLKVERRRAAGDARGRSAGRDARRPVGAGGRPHVRSRRAEPVGGHRQRPGPHLGQGHPDRRQDFAQQLRRPAGRHRRPRARRARAHVARRRRRGGRNRVVRLGHRLCHSAGKRAGLAARHESRPRPARRAAGRQPQGRRLVRPARRAGRRPRHRPGLQGRLPRGRYDRRGRRPAGRAQGAAQARLGPALRR